GDFLAGFGDADDDGHAPAAVAGFQRLAHHIGVAGAVEGVIGAAVRQRYQVLNDVAANLGRVDEMGHAEAATPIFLRIIDLHADDLVGADHPGALDHVEPDATQPEHHDVRAGLNLGGVDHGANARGDAAADIAALVEWRVLADFGDRDLRQHGEVRKRR